MGLAARRKVTAKRNALADWRIKKRAAGGYEPTRCIAEGSDGIRCTGKPQPNGYGYCSSCWNSQA